MSRLHEGDAGLAPESILEYIDDMLLELVHLAEVNGHEPLGMAIRRAAASAPGLPKVGASQRGL